MSGKIAKEQQGKTTRAQMIANEQIHRIERYVADEKREGRLKQLECRTCFYLRTAVAGAAFTPGKCEECEQTFQHPNTAVPPYCESCATTHQVCRRCGSALDFTDMEPVPSGLGERTRHGFRWGNLEVIRICNDRRAGRVLFIKTEKQRLQVRVTGSGLIRVDVGVEKA